MCGRFDGRWPKRVPCFVVQVGFLTRGQITRAVAKEFEGLVCPRTLVVTALEAGSQAAWLT